MVNSSLQRLPFGKKLECNRKCNKATMIYSFAMGKIMGDGHYAFQDNDRGHKSIL